VPSFFRSSRLTSAAYFRTCSHWHFAKTAFIQFTDKLFVDATWEGERGKWGGREAGRGQLSQTCSRRNNQWLLNRKHTRFLWGRRYRYENVLALRKRTTCLVSSVSFVSRFLPVNKPGLHPPAAARHPPSKHKARWLVVSWYRKARRYSFAVSLFLSLGYYSHTILICTWRPAPPHRTFWFTLDQRHSLFAVSSRVCTTSISHKRHAYLTKIAESLDLTKLKKAYTVDKNNPYLTLYDIDREKRFTQTW